MSLFHEKIELKELIHNNFKLISEDLNMIAEIGVDKKSAQKIEYKLRYLAHEIKTEFGDLFLKNKLRLVPTAPRIFIYVNILKQINSLIANNVAVDEFIKKAAHDTIVEIAKMIEDLFKRYQAFGDEHIKVEKHFLGHHHLNSDMKEMMRNTG
ncbi:hypothetical protein HN814_08750 [Candidatus Woesearchaeota archaeon]|nr:hypothetical protein [Candidatus Woesearchaeota archaeon]